MFLKARSFDPERLYQDYGRQRERPPSIGDILDGGARRRLPMVSHRRPCPKCGNSWVTRKYSRINDLISCTCDGCGHGWNERPLDDKEG